MPLPASSPNARTVKLARHARPLKPIRPPFYVQHATAECVLTGWWWQPAGAVKPEPLAENYENAFLRIHDLKQAQVAEKVAA